MMISLLPILIVSCGEKLPTPPAVDEAHREPRSGFDDDTSGRSIERLERFGKGHGDHLITVTAKDSGTRFRVSPDGVDPVR